MGAWLREATVWQRVGRLVPLSWILILVWPLLLLVTGRTPATQLAVSLFAMATFVGIWTWFWLEPRNGSDPRITAVVLGALTAIGLALTLSNPRVFHDGLLGYCMVVAAVWPGWRPSLLSIPAVALLIFLAVAGTGAGGINAFGVALAWLFLGFGFVAVLQLLKTNLRLEHARAKARDTNVVALERLAMSPRQMEIMNLVAMGLSDKQIAARLNVSPYTVRTHLQRLYSQHGLHNRAEATATWIKGRPGPTEEIKTG